jgi:DNA polymerase III epsilon subunit-like protein
MSTMILNFDTVNTDLTPYAVVVDVATTGLNTAEGTPTKMKLKEDPYCYGGIVQIAWIVLSEEFDVVSKGASYIKQNREIPEEAVQIHGISTRDANSKGRDLKKVLQEFSRQIEFCDFIVGHYVDYDKQIIEADCLRSGISKPFKGKRKYCTMQKAYEITDRKFSKLQAIVEELGIEFKRPLPVGMCAFNAELDCVYAASIYSYLNR